ncbi:SIS domain-containing protein [Phytohabitans flavus]|uniref:Phosphoheptose isomerase n=1 Tax=Phytohabitans flavus TaxID=1076124 RepID=A0A6F8XSA0_9ACTN|nr:SIS domain-containing protein [Phytohabitans flavus]BCB76628.1 phosphoheptose isomerase [Phytohabitans flavus]
MDATSLALGASQYLDELKKVIDQVDVDQVTAVIDTLVRVHDRAGSVYIFGNGGSASTASHFVTDFNKGIGASFRLACLNDNVPTVLAVANDIGYDQVFVHQLHSLLDPTDLVIAISGSGNSPNVVEAVRYAKGRDVETVALVGYDGGQLRELADHCIHVPVPDMQKVEDVHLAMNHLMMTVLKDYLGSRDR